jgi:hypothetical protein
MAHHWRGSFVEMAAIATACLAWALPAFGQAAIFTCVDAQGTRLTADRPILECNDRTQHELNRDGTLRRIIPPQPTAAERAAAAEKARQLAEQERRQADDRQRQRALLARYPNAAVLARDREASLVSIQDAIATNHRRTTELLAESRRLEEEAKSFAKDPGRMPQSLRRQIADNAQNLQSQKKLLDDKEQERLRISGRFDAAQRELAPLWAAQGQ